MNVAPPYPRPPIKLMLAGVLLPMLLSAVVGGCQQAPAPATITPIVQAGVNATCTMLEGVTPNKTVLQVCATAEEVAAVADLIARVLRTEKPRSATLSGAQTAAEGGCTPLVGTAVCASREELGVALPVLLARRAAPFQLEAGAP